ncbi:MAG: lysylphosphatidylglycerol synthase transmembrane domain-containing protein, partial [Solirubrobacteraceae bacterium]
DRDALNATMASGLRKLRNSVVSLAVFFLLIVGLLLAVPGLRATGDQITDAQVGWVLGGVGLEVLSCAGYVVLFELVFGRLGRSLTSRLSLSELAVNSVVSVSGLAGIALGAWVLRSKGFSLERIARRSVLIFVLTSAVNVAAVAVIGVSMWLGLIGGSRNPLLTVLPAAVALATIVATIALASWARRAAERRAAAGHGRLAVALSAVGGGVQEALGLISEHDWRLLGALGYWLFDNLVLFACFAAFGHAPSFWVIAMAYLVGMLANSLPVPGGFIAVEGGLVGMLLLFHIRPGSAVIAAVVLYRAISLWIPSIVGGIAFLSLRQEIGKPLIVSSEAQAGG